MIDLKFRRHSVKDIPYRVRWLNNPRANFYVGEAPGDQKTTLAKQRAWFEAYRNNSAKRFFTICDGRKPIGMMGFSSISRINRNADLFIIIGEDDYRGRGVGRQAVSWLIDYGFDRLNLHKINLGVFKENRSAVALYKSLGFVVEGRIKDEVFSQGRFHDSYSMALFRAVRPDRGTFARRARG